MPSSVKPPPITRSGITSPRNRGFYAGWLIFILGVFGGGCWLFVPAFFRVKTPTDALSFLPFIAFLLLWCGIGSRIALERLPDLRWRKDMEAREEDVTAAIAKARWYGNRLNVTIAGRTYSLDDLMDADMRIIARELRRALPGVIDAGA